MGIRLYLENIKYDNGIIVPKEKILIVWKCKMKYKYSRDNVMKVLISEKNIYIALCWEVIAGKNKIW